MHERCISWRERERKRERTAAATTAVAAVSIICHSLSAQTQQQQPLQEEWVMLAVVCLFAGYAMQRLPSPCFVMKWRGMKKIELQSSLDDRNAVLLSLPICFSSLFYDG